ncbi:hypothetical protein EI94DRAFT_1667630, partial [Lactarius quietus]
MKFARYLDNAQAPEWKRAYIDYRGLKKRIMAIKSAQQGGNDLHLTRTMSSDSEHESLPSGAGASKWTRRFNRREKPDGTRVTHAQDEQQKQPAVMDAPGTQIELDELRMGGDDILNVGAVFLSQGAFNNFFPEKTT